MIKKYSDTIKAFSFFLCGLLPFSMQAHSQQIPDTQKREKTSPFDQIVVLGARTPLRRADTTTALSILEAEDLRQQGAVFLSEALRSVPGAAVSTSGPFGSLTQIRLRGAEANHVLVMVDGVEASDPLTGEFPFSDMLSAGVRRVEIARGEQSALWGAGAIGGVINIQTFSPQDDPFFAAFGEMGSLKTRRFGFSGLAPLGAARFGASVFSLKSDGFDVSGQKAEPEAYENTTTSLHAFLPLGDSWSLKAWTRVREGQAGYDVDKDFDGRLDNVPHVRFSQRFLSAVSLEGKSGRFEHGFTAYLLNDKASTDGGDFSQNKGQRITARYVGSFKTGEGSSPHHRLTWLLEAEETSYKHDAGPRTRQNRRTTRFAYALDYRLDWNAASFALSARKDHNPDFKDALTWRLGAAWRFESFGGKLRASFGEAVKNPGFYERYGYFPDLFKGNPSLKPERSQGFDVGFEQTFLEETVFWSITGFSSRLRDEIYTDFAAKPTTARNRRFKSTRQGVEIEAGWQPYDTLKISASAAFINAKERGKQEDRRPRTLVSASINWTPSPLSFTLGASYTGQQKDKDFGSFPARAVTLKAYTLVYTRLALQIRPDFELYFRGDNLLNEQYHNVFGYAQPGRTLYAGVRFEL